MKFNLGKFNLGKFNLTTTENTRIIADSLIEVDSFIEGVQKKMFSVKLTSEVQLDTISKSVLKKYFKGETSLYLETRSNSGIKILNNGPLIAELEIGSDAIGNIVGEEFISFENLELKPGQELIINTCDLTATINGENAISYLSKGVDFFDFLSGDNYIIISCENSNGITANVYWKDRWL